MLFGIGLAITSVSAGDGDDTVIVASGPLLAGFVLLVWGLIERSVNPR